METVQAVCQWLVVLYLSWRLLVSMFRNRVRNNDDWSELFIHDLIIISAFAMIAVVLYGAGCFTKIIGGE